MITPTRSVAALLPTKNERRSKRLNTPNLLVRLCGMNEGNVSIAGNSLLNHISLPFKVERKRVEIELVDSSSDTIEWRKGLSDSALKQNKLKQIKLQGLSWGLVWDI
jgi:hypothetical protein